MNEDLREIYWKAILIEKATKGELPESDIERLKSIGVDIPRSLPGDRPLRKFYRNWETSPCEKFLEDLVFILKNLAILDVLNLIASITIILSLIGWWVGRQERRENELFATWSVIKNASGDVSGVARVAAERLNRKGFSLFRLDLRETDLSNADLRKADLREADLSSANLSGANLRRASLNGTNLSHADLSRADLWTATLQHTKLEGAELRGVNLMRATLIDLELVEAQLPGVHFEGASLSNVNFEGASLTGAKLTEIRQLSEDPSLNQLNLKRADLRGAELQRADLRHANLQGADLGSPKIFQVPAGYIHDECASFGREFSADLQGATLSHASLQRAELIGTNLQDAELSYADLQEATLADANLQGAILIHANLKTTQCLTQEQIEPALLCYTILPDDIARALDSKRNCLELGIDPKSGLPLKD
jgi:uncharacterized protein YjbI with pentapeptide repeats